MKNFWQKVLKTDSCWNWIAAKNNKGYGVFCIKRKAQLAHRVSWLVHHGNPGNLYVLHKCDNPACVNPNHLFLGTQRDNIKDCCEKNRFQHGEKHGMHKLTKKQVIEIRTLIDDGVKNKEISKMFGMSETCISDIKRGVTWVK